MPLQSLFIQAHPDTKPIAGYRNSNVGFNNPFRLLRFLLLPPTAAHILHARFRASRSLHLRNPSPRFPAAKVPAVPGCHVRGSGSIIHHPDCSRSCEVRLADADVAYESGLDGADDGVEFDGGRVVRYAGK
jgi:hypothetical protein